MGRIQLVGAARASFSDEKEMYRPAKLGEDKPQGNHKGLPLLWTGVAS